MPEILDDKVTGLLVERGSDAALTNALRYLAIDSATRDRMGSEARRRAEQHFDWEVPAARLESLYRPQSDAPLEEESVRVTGQTQVAAP